ncbi:MAG: putative bifunctional diguanylate cyclase/phosphodiesterase [Methylophagaceae bacterium]
MLDIFEGSLKPKILVVDDTPANLIAMKTILKKLPAELVMVESGAEALKEAIQDDFAVILLDVNMPGMDGFEVAELLSSAEETKHIPIIFVTAVHHDEASLLKGYDSGGVDYVQKPVLPEILLSKIDVFLDLWLLKAGLEDEVAMRRAAELKVQYLAQHDALTHLPNRRQIHTELDLIIDRVNRKKEQFALLFLDLDGFKKINDELGHEYGDALLVEMAARYKKIVRTTDLVGRFGGDEFILVFTELTDPMLLKNKLQQLIAESAREVIHKDKVIHTSASIGVALYPQHGTAHDILISNADSAMYLAKGIGKNTFQFYSTELNQQMERNLLIEHHLRKAFNAEAMEVYYQPIIDLTSRTAIGAEALLRWNSDALGFVSPEEFIPIAESAGLITDIGLWVLHQVVDLMQQYPEKHFAVNASSLQFNNNLLTASIKQYIKQGKINPSLLEIEITESLLLDRSGKAEEQLQAIHDLGVSISVDDFGTGYSSLSYLKNCPVATVKIDRSFVSNIPNDKDDMTLVKTIIAMAKGLNLKVITEGVETLEQMDFIKQEGCLLAQGYFFAKPMTKEDFKQYLLLEEEGMI